MKEASVFYVLPLLSSSRLTGRLKSILTDLVVPGFALNDVGEWYRGGDTVRDS